MKPKRKAREACLQVLFQREFHESTNAEELFSAFADNFILDDEVRDYALHLTQGVLNKEQDINAIIERYSTNWRLDRMASIDRILLQIAIFELCFIDDLQTPAKICMSDIIDLAKKYSSEESKNFINGILDQVYQKEVGA
ncbi:MAG: transcription antitermination factor NusB [Bdellovibrionales bacterium]|nr:transcription antitermination factor NusB [Bdellovibrionales bacterium]